MSNIQFFAPFKKIDEATRRVWGVASVEEPDNSKEIMDYATTKPQVVAWSSRLAKSTGGKNLGNVRAMHGEVAAGHLVELECDDLTKSFPVCAEITDDNEWRKVKDGTYTGFSFGGRYAKKWDDPVLKGFKRYTAVPRELSLADVPCVPGAIITMVKTDGTEVQIEAHGSVQQFWGCGTPGHEHFQKKDAEECFSDALSKPLSKVDAVEELLKYGRVLSTMNASSLLAAADQLKNLSNLINIVLQNAGYSIETTDSDDPVTRGIPEVAIDSNNDISQGTMKTAGADDDLKKATSPGAGDDRVTQIDATSTGGNEMTKEEMEQLAKALSDQQGETLRKVLGSDELKKTLTGVVTEVVSEELKKTAAASDARFKAVEENIDLVGESLAKFFGAPADEKSPTVLVTKEGDSKPTDDLAKKDDSISGSIKQALRNPINFGGR